MTKFAYGRDETKATGLYGNTSKNPAPNTYNLKDTISTIKFSFGERTKAKRIHLINVRYLFGVDYSFSMCL